MSFLCPVPQVLGYQTNFSLTPFQNFPLVASPIISRVYGCTQWKETGPHHLIQIDSLSELLLMFKSDNLVTILSLSEFKHNFFSMKHCACGPITFYPQCQHIS